MTDREGSELHEHGAHEIGDDHGHDASSSEAGGWGDDQAPVDDFDDSAHATVSEETEGMEEMPAVEAGAKKAFPVLPVVAGVGGLLLVGAIVYWQFGSSPPAPPPLPIVVAAAPAPKPPAPLPQMPTSDVASKPAVVANTDTDIGSLKQGSTADTAPKTGMSSVVDTAAPAPSLPPATTVAAPIAPVSPKPPSTTPTVTPTVTTPAAPPSMPPSQPGTVDARLDDLQKAVAQATQQVTQLSNMIAAGATAAPAQGSPALEDRLTRIEQQLAQMQHGAPALVSPTTATTEDTKMPAAAESGMGVMEEPAAKPAIHKPQHRARHTSTRHIRVARAGATPRWVLRAATPDEAWVSANASSATLRRVQVGDTLPGVGKIRAIRQNGDDWTIEGSLSNVR